MKTILITGINGFLGSHLAKELSSEYNILGLEYSLENLFRIESSGFKVYSSEEDLEQIFIQNKIFAIIHAATVYRRDNTEPLKSLLKTNILLPVSLYELAEKYNCNLFLNTDTFFNSPEYCYGDLPDYTLSKKQVLEWLRVLTKKCKLVNMKIFHMYGPDDAPNKFIPQMVAKLRSNVASIDLTLGEQIRDFIYIDDVVNAYSIILQNQAKIHESFKEIQVGTGNGTSIKELLSVIKGITNSETQLKFGALPYRDNGIMYSIADNSFLIKLGWNTKYILKNGIMNIISKLNSN